MNIETTMSQDLKRGYFSFEVGVASNGFIFGEYSVNSDAYSAVVAKTPAELCAELDRWLDARKGTIRAWAEHKERQFPFVPPPAPVSAEVA